MKTFISSLLLLFTICCYGQLHPFSDAEAPKKVKIEPSKIFDDIVTNRNTSISLQLGATTSTLSVQPVQTMEDDFYKLYPNISSFIIKDVDIPGSMGRMTLTPDKVWITMSGSPKLVSVFPHEGGHVLENKDTHMHAPTCDHDESDPTLMNEEWLRIEKDLDKRGESFSFGDIKRRFRFAVVCTGEFYQFNGNNNTSVAAAITATIDGMNVIYTRDLNVELVGLTPFLYNNPNTDPFIPEMSGGNGRTEQAGTQVNNVFNSNSYDIGHVFHVHEDGDGWGNGGLASVGVVCNSTGNPIRKARGWSGAYNSNGFSWIGLAAHEVGHMFSARHTFNGTGESCTMSIGDESAVEIASGNTIMSYNGICQENQNIPSFGAQDNYFHTFSLTQMKNFILNGTNCAVEVNTNNTPPTVNANPCGASYILPKNTPYRLTGSADDAEGDPMTYSWEQMDEDGAGVLTQGEIGNQAANNTIGPLVRCYPPATSITRYIPPVSNVVNNINDPFEVLSNREREITYHLTVRDNNASGGAITTSEIVIQNISEGPLSVSNLGLATAGSTQTIQWNTGGSEEACQQVTISLSIDNGVSFPFILATGVDYASGTQDVTFPTSLINTDQARVKVECADFECFSFYDISNAFNISSECTAAITYICDTDPVSHDQGDPALNLDVISVEGEPSSNFSIFINQASSPLGPAIMHLEDGTGCEERFNIIYENVSFYVLESGTYSFDFDMTIGKPFGALFEADDYNPSNPCPSFVAASASRFGMDQLSRSGIFSADLEACQEYILTLYNLDSGNTVIEDVSGPSTIILTNDDPDLDYAFTFVAVNENGIVSAVSDQADFTTTPGGVYDVYSVSYKTLGPTPPAIVDPADWVGIQYSTILSQGDCQLFSSNSKPMEILSACTITDIVAIDQTDCDPATNTYDQTLQIFFEEPPTNGSIRVTVATAGGATEFPFPVSATSPQTVIIPGLVSDGSMVDVSAFFTDLPGCSIALQDVYMAPDGCCPVDVDLEDVLTVCENEIIPLDASGNGVAFKWFLNGDEIVGATDPTLIPTQSGIYAVEVQANTGCIVSDATLVTLLEAPSAVLPDDRSICEGQSDNISADVTGQQSLVWYRDGIEITGVTIPFLEINQSGTYTIDVNNSSGCMDSDTIVVTSVPAPVVDLGDDVDLCEDDGPVTLDAGTDGTIYTWRLDGILLSESSSTLSASQSGEYTVVVDDGGGCTSSDTVTVTYYDLPIADAGVDMNICQGGDDLILSYTAIGESFLWTKDGSLNINQDNPLIISEPGEYVLEVRNEIDCAVSDTIIITEVIPPDVDLGDDIIACEGSEVQLSTSLDGEYIWTKDGVTFSIEASVTLTESGTYELTVNNGAMCNDSDTVVVSFVPGPSLEIGNDQEICEGGSFTITADTDETMVTWYLDGVEITGENSTTIDVSAAGEYTAEIVAMSGCVVEDRMTLTVNPLPSVSLGDNRNICEGESIEILSGVDAASYSWSLNGTEISTDPNVEISTAGMVSIIVMNEFGCVASDNIEVIVNSNPTLSIEDSYRFCEGESVDVTVVSDASTFEWNVNGTTLAETGSTISVNEVATISVTVTNSNNCSTMAMTEALSSAAPVVDLGEDQELCPGDNITLLAGNHSSYMWSTGDDSDNIIIENTSTAEVTIQTISVTVTNDDNCESSDEVTITLLPELMPQVSGSAPGVCGGEPVTLTATGGTTFVWVDPNGSLSDINENMAIASPLETTTYEVIASNEQCPQSEVSTSVTIEVFEKGDDVSAGDETCVILGQSTTLSATGGVSYQWDTTNPIIGPSDVADPEINPIEETTYHVTITDGNGCEYTDSVDVCILEDPLAEFLLVSIITPNGDGDNDLLVFRGLEVFPDNKLTIYNRWGNIVFEKIGYQQDDRLWDGTAGGSDLPADTYYYILTFDGNTYKSDITIMR